MTHNGPTQSQIATSKAIQRQTGSTFHVATRAFPERIRYPTYVLYAFFRKADEVVDDPGDRTPEQQRKALEEIREAVKGQTDTKDPVLRATSHLRQTHDIPPEEIDVFIDSMLADVSTDRYATYEDLEAYLRGSSVAVANMLIAVMAPDLPEDAHPHAKALAEAFQLTNFIRDVREDVEKYDRIYLPRATLEKYGVSERTVRERSFGPGMAGSILHELERTEDLYRTGVEGIRYLPKDVQFPVLLAAVLYAEHHRLIRRQGYNVLSDRPELTKVDRVRAFARTALHWQITKDPEVTFERASAVPAQTDNQTAYARDTVRPVMRSVADGLMRWLP